MRDDTNEPVSVSIECLCPIVECAQEQADIGIMHTQMPGDRALSIAVFLDRLGDLPIPLLPVLYF